MSRSKPWLIHTHTQTKQKKHGSVKMFLLAHRWTCWWWGGGGERGGKKKWNWQYHCRSALKGRRSAPLHWSRDVYSGRRRRGRVPLCHRLLCRLTFQLVVIRSSPCLGASFSAFVSGHQIPQNRSDMSRRILSFDVFPDNEEDYPRGGKTWRGKTTSKYLR